MDCRTDKSYSLKKNVGFKLPDVINTKEQTIINSIKNAFEGENMQTQYNVLGLIFIFMKINLQLTLMNQDMLTEILIMKWRDKKHQKNVFIRINSDNKDFSIFKEINKIHRHIKKTFKKSLMNKI